ncbi:MAG: glycosyltransferase [Saprospiraceae bacterium]|nr:glycosyltransferase [Saprospiraceae bacterium]
MTNKILFISGMHRSGTSALSGLLNQMNFNIGHSVMNAKFDNPKGFFENRRISNFNERLLLHLNASWNFPHGITENWIQKAHLDDFYQEAADLFESEFDSSQPILIKDPRLSLLFPFWEQFCERHLLDARFLIALRHPIEIAHSLKSRNGFSLNHGLFLWYHYIKNIEKSTRQKPRFFVNFEALIKDPIQISNDLITWLNAGFGDQLNLKHVELAKIDASLKTQNADQIRDNLPDIFQKFYDNLKELSGNSNSEKALQRIDELSASIDSVLTIGLNQEVSSNIIKQKHDVPSHLVLRSNDSFYDQQSLNLTLNTSQKTQYIKFDFKSCPVNEIQWTPLSGSWCKVTLNQVTLLNDSVPAESKIKNIQSNANEVTDKTYVFKNSNPSFTFTIAEQINGIIIKFDLEMISGTDKDEIINSAFLESQLEYQQKDLEYQQKDVEYQENVLAYQQKDFDHQQEIAGYQKEISDYKQQVSEYEQKDLEYQQKVSTYNQKISDYKQKVSKHKQRASRYKQKVSQHKLSLLEMQEALRNMQVVKHNEEIEDTEIQSKISEFEYYIEDRVRDANLKGELINNIKQSLSYRIGWLITAPIRLPYNWLENMTSESSKTNIFLAGGLMFLKHPIKFLKNINLKNYKTLRHALKHENPKEIKNNLLALVAGKKSAIVDEISYKEEAPQTSPNPIAEHFSQSGKPKLLYISPNLPDYDMSSGGKRAARMLALLNEDFEVYVFTFGEKPERHIKKLESLNLHVVAHRSLEKLRKEIPRIDCIVYAWYYSLFDGHALLSWYPNARIVVDSVDVHWVREERSIGLIESLTVEKVKANKLLEIESYKQADILWAVTENDKQAILKEIPDATVWVVSNIHESEDIKYQDSNNNNILFFGGFNHYPNVSAIERLANTIVPIVRKEIPDAELIIAGSKASEEIQKLGERDGISYLGFIEEEDMSSLYDNAFITAVPLLAGAGIKGKICEAIAHSLPILTNAIGNEGIELVHEKECLLAETDEEFANMLIKAARREYDFEKMCSSAQDKLEQLVSPGAVKRNMLDSIYPPVVICIVTWNRLELVRRCIESIEEHTRYPNYKIAVHSNGCEDGTQEYLEKAAALNDKIVPILSDKNEVFVLPNNNMMHQFPDHDVILLNNDTYVTPNWLIGLFEAAYASADIGVSGSKILYPDGTLQEFGSELYATGTGRNIGKFENADNEEYKITTKVGYVSGCSMYIKRSTIEKIGVFDEQFHPCYCEDSDYCYTAKEAGLDTVVTPYSIIYHEEGKTSGTDTSKGFKAYQEINMKKFLAKHKGKENGIDWNKLTNE